MDFSSSSQQLPPSYQPPLKRPASHISSDDDDLAPQDEHAHHPDYFPEEENNGINNPSAIAVEQKEWRDLSTPSLASAASDDLHERRPNRWSGNPSTWRTWTRNERKTWESMENVRRGDLAVHLYNAFALKKGVRKAPEERFFGGSRREGQQQQQQSQGGGWNVGRQWVAWPLGVGEVPGDEVLDLEADDGNQGFTFRKEDDGEKYAGTNLEGEVSAAVLRLAKERFYRRVKGWEREDKGDEEGEGDVVQSIEQDGEEGGVGDEEDDDDLDVETGFDTAAGDYDTDATGAASVKGGNKRRMSTTAKAEATFTPVLSADDDRNYALVRPAARRIMGQLDKTLTVLHHARAAAVTDIYGFDTDEEDDSEAEGDERARNSMMDVDERPGRKRPRGRSRAGSRPRRFRFRSRSRSSSSDSSTGSNVSTKISRIGLQNWRDVLGAAALAGFSPEVIARATQRCSNLFNEEMVMHTLPEQAVTSDKPAIQTVRYQPKLSGSPSIVSDDDDYEYNEQLLAHRRTISRQSTAALTTGPANAPAPAAKRAGTPAAPSRRSRSATPGGGGPHLCPFIDCGRAAEGFSRKANLQRHIRLVHHNAAQPVQTTDHEEDSEDELVGGVHTDGFLQPIKIRKGWRGDDTAQRQRKFRTKPRVGSRDTDDEDNDHDRDSR